MEESDVVEIPPPVNWASKPRSLKRKEVFCPGVIDVDDYKGFSASMKSDHKFKGKQTVTDLSYSSAGTYYNTSGSDVKATGVSYKGSKYSKGTFYDDLIYVDDDAPTGFEVSMPRVTDANGKKTNLFTGSASTQPASRAQAEPKSFPSSKSYSHPLPLLSKTEHVKANNVARNGGAPQAYGRHVNSDSGKKSLLPHVHSVQNHTPTAANMFPKTPLPSNNIFQNLQNQIHTAAKKIPKASIPTHNGSFFNLGPNMYTGMSSILGVNQMLPGFNSLPQKPSTPASYYPGPIIFSDLTAFKPSFPKSVGIHKDLTSFGVVSSSAGPSSFKIVNENPDVILKKLDEFKKFDTVEDFSDHFYSTSNAFVKNQPPKSWSKKIQGEWRILENNLPDTIFVRVCESRMDLLRAAIIGAQGTPYHDGLFFFDVFFPRDYPNVPPKVNYHSGGLCINPNLYDCGKVCLSLLNTWDGDRREMWIPGESTILQVLVSIQALVLNENPFFNEPEYEFESGTFEGENDSLNYNEGTYINSLRTMVYCIRQPPKHFEDLVVGHFFKRAPDILAACRAYMNGAQVGSVVVKGGVESVSNKDQRGNSQRFKNNLAGVLKTLVEAFGHVAVKDCDKFLH